MRTSLQIIPQGWSRQTLGEFVTFQRGHDLPTPDRKAGTVPIMGSFGDVTGFHNEAIAQGPGVTVGRSGSSFGAVGLSRKNYWPLNTVLYVINFHGNDPIFVYYFLKSIDFTRFNSGSAQPSLNRNHIHPMEITVPPLETQRAISSILSALDDKIELNRRMNRTLEATARALFKSWFVDFDPVHANAEGRVLEGLSADVQVLFPSSFEGGVPNGWEARGLDGIAQFLNGLALQKFPPTGDDDLPVIKIAQLRKGNTNDSDQANSSLPPEYVIEDGDVLFSWSGSLEVVLWAGGRGALNQHLFKVTSDEFPKWFYYLWVREHLSSFQATAASKATTMGHIQRKHLTQARVTVPEADILKMGDSIIAPLITQFFNNCVESHALAAARDSLLPKLLSGELEVRDVQDSLEVVG